MVAETMFEQFHENSEKFLDQDSLIGTKQDTAMINGKLPNGFKDSSSTSERSNIQITIVSKRSMLDLNGSIYSDKKKRFKTIENGREKQDKINTCINTVHNEENNNKIDCTYISRLKKSSPAKNLAAVKNSSEVQNDLITEHHDTLSECKRINDNNNFNEYNDIHEDDYEMVSYINNLVDIVCYFSSIDQNNHFSDKTNYYNKLSQNSKNNSSNLRNSTSVSHIQIDNKETLLTNNYYEYNQSNKVICDDSQLNTSAPNSIPISDSGNNTEKIKAKIPTFTFLDNSIRNSGNNNSENTYDLSHLSNKNMTTILQIAQKISEDSFSELKTILNNKDLTLIEFDKLCSQMVFEQMDNIFDKGTIDKRLMEFKSRFKFLRTHFKSLMSKQSEVECLITNHKGNKNNEELSQSTKKRTVAIQTEYGSNNNDLFCCKNKEQPIVISDDEDNDKHCDNNDGDHTEMTTLIPKNSGLSLCTKIIEKKNGVPSVPNVLQNSSVIVIDEDSDDEYESKTLNSDNSSLPLCTNISQKKKQPVIHIDHNKLKSKIENSGLSSSSKINKRKNASVIQIDNNELKSKTLHPDNSELPSSTKISQTKECESRIPRLVAQEHVHVISDDDTIIDLDKKASDKQVCVNTSGKKKYNKKLSKEVTRPHVHITSDCVTAIDTITPVNQSCSKIIKKKSTNERLSSNQSTLCQYITQKRVPTEKDNRRLCTIDVNKNDETNKHNLENSHSSKAISQWTVAAINSLTSLSSQRKSRSLVLKNRTCLVPNLSRYNKMKLRCKIRKYSNSKHVQASSLNGMKKKFSYKNITNKNIRPLFLKSGKFVPIESSNTDSGFLKTNTISTSTAHQRLAFQNKGLLGPRPSLTSSVSKHPAPLPIVPKQNSLSSWKELPSAPNVQVKKSYDLNNEPVLIISWNMCITQTVAHIKCYQIFVYHEVSTETPNTDIWKQVGEVAALPLPMTCSLSEVDLSQKYHFAVRAIDVHNRVGPFSSPESLFSNE